MLIVTDTGTFTLADLVEAVGGEFLNCLLKAGSEEPGLTFLGGPYNMLKFSS